MPGSAKRRPVKRQAEPAPPETVIGLIPAAGYSRRLAPIPCSKEIYPIGYRQLPGGKGVRPIPVCQYLMDKMVFAGVRQIYWVLRKGKWDIAEYLGDGSEFNVELAYRVMDFSPGPVFTLDHAYPFVREATVAFGFPDIIFSTKDAFRQLLARRLKTGADVVLGLFPIDVRVRDDRIVVDSTGRIVQFLLGESGKKYPHTWNIAVWAPAFTSFMHEYVADIRPTDAVATEQTVGQLIEAAFRHGLRMDGVLFENDSWTDIGTPAGMGQALRKYGRL